jgi:hypothetical protein
VQRKTRDSRYTCGPNCFLFLNLYFFFSFFFSFLSIVSIFNVNGGQKNVYNFFLKLKHSFTCPILVFLIILTDGLKAIAHFDSFLFSKCYTFLTVIEPLDFFSLSFAIYRRRKVIYNNIYIFVYGG